MLWGHGRHWVGLALVVALTPAAYAQTTDATTNQNVVGATTAGDRVNIEAARAQLFQRMLDGLEAFLPLPPPSERPSRQQVFTSCVPRCFGSPVLLTSFVRSTAAYRSRRSHRT